MLVDVLAGRGCGGQQERHAISLHLYVLERYQRASNGLDCCQMVVTTYYFLLCSLTILWRWLLCVFRLGGLYPS